MSRRAAILAVVAFLLLGGGAVVLLPGLRRDSRAEIFLARDHPARASFTRFREEFGGDAFALVTCRAGPAPETAGRIRELAARLGARPEVERIEVPVPGSPLTRALSLASPDGSRVTLVVFLAAGHGDSVPAVRAVLAEFPDLRPGLAGQPVLNVVLDEAADSVGKRIFPILAAVMALLIAAAYRSLAVTLAVGAASGISVACGMAFLALLDRPVNLITVLLPVLLLALTVAICVHLVNSYRQRRAAGLSSAAAVRAMRRAELRPCLVTALTTAAGYGSFAFSRIEPLRDLGVAMAVSILVAFAVVWRLLPALLTLLAPRPAESLRIGALLNRLVPPIVARRGPVLLGSLLVLAAGVVVAPLVPRETNGLAYLPASSDLRRETQRLVEEGVGTASLEVVLSAGPGRDASALLEPLRRMEREIAGRAAEPGSSVRGVITALTLAREGAFRMGLADPRPAEAAALDPAPGPLEARLRAFRDPTRGRARVSVLIDTVGAGVWREIRSRAEGVVQAALADLPGATYSVTGEFPVIMAVQEELIDTLLLSLAGTALTILLLISVANRSLRLGLLTVLPAVLPLAVVVLLCRAAGIALSISTVMVMAVILGITTDDSVHLLHALRRDTPLPDVLAGAGTAVAETSIALFLGFAVLAGADFLPTRDFGLLAAAGVVAAFVADLLLFPVLVAGRAVAGTAPARPAAVHPRLSETSS